MSTHLSSETKATEGATVVITHRVRNDKHATYEKWVEEISPMAKGASGFLDWHMVRPIRGISETYAVIIRFDTDTHLKEWMDSPTRASLIEKVRPLLVTGDDFFVRSGLDFWFTPAGAKAQVPVRWKQYLITWSAIYPLVLGVSFIAELVFKYFGVPNNRFITTLVVTAIVVCLMVYVVMPRYTKLISRWLFHK